MGREVIKQRAIKKRANPEKTLEHDLFSYRAGTSYDFLLDNGKVLEAGKIVHVCTGDIVAYYTFTAHLHRQLSTEKQRN